MTRSELLQKRDDALDVVDRLYRRKAGIVKRAKRERDPMKRRNLWYRVERISNQILAAAKVADELCKAAG